MPRRKKSIWQKYFVWLKSHRRISILLIILVLILVYGSIHAYRGWADTRRLHASRSAIDKTYAAISQKLGQPDDLQTTNACYRQVGLTGSYILCGVETDFIYGTANQTQAEIFMNQIQKVIENQGAFKAKKKPVAHLTNTLVVDTYSHMATDYYRGPYGSACTVKYSFATPDEVTLSLRNSSLQPFEVFFACTHKSVRTIYPALYAN